MTDVRPFEDCSIVTVISEGRETRQFLTPFDTITPIAARTRPRPVSNAVWRRASRAVASGAVVADGLNAAAWADCDLLPYQLEPTLAIVRGYGCRVLLADEVGLGKTIQAGLIASELLARDAIERVLVLTPAGLREQWQEEWCRRFRIEARIADASAVRSSLATLPAGTNPWRTWPIAIVSIDYVKRPEVLRAVADARWDLVIVDEAHGAANDSDRHHAADALATRASFVLLLTATPHDGVEQTFTSLCEIGAVDGDPLLVFRRTRADAGMASRRRVRTWPIGTTRAERRMHRLLDRYIDALAADRGDWQLAASVLRKRAYSSAWSLAETVDRRLHRLGGAEDDPSQLPLPLGLAGDVTTVDEAPAWPSDIRLADAERDRVLLRSLGDSAREAGCAESKIRVLRRLLRRVAEPAIVFTEFRDTLRHVQASIPRETILLHGGLTPVERREALRRFRASPTAVLLATDAAGEGLNLQDTCRLVINLEVPWNPVRLEQRIGRVDRIGQHRIVHALLLVSAIGETRLLDRFTDRAVVAANALVRPGPDGLVAAAASETQRLEAVRGNVDPISIDGPWITTARRRWRRATRGRGLTISRAVAEHDDGRVVALTALDSTDTDRLDEWRRTVIATVEAFADTRLARERAIARSIGAAAAALYQPGLFDRRRDRAHHVAATADATHRDDIAARIARIERQRIVTFAPPTPVLIRR
ncbi:MAG TPA: helicase-related protein [Vicinamibacterales bacterium]|nr:helicase-related protein [Vicinamibacterales bacterium]